MGKIETTDDGTEELLNIIKDSSAKEVKTNKAKSKKNSKKELKTHPAVLEKTDEEIHLHKLIFGDREGLLKNLADSVAEKPRKYLKSSDDEQTNSGEIGQHTPKSKKRKAAWTDADDETIKVEDIQFEAKNTGPKEHLKKYKSYKDYLVSQYNRVVSQPKWANLDQNPADDNSDDEILRTVGFLSKKSSILLPVDHLEYKRLKDLNRATYAEGVITGVQFHPTSTAALVSGLSGIATIYSIDGLKNEKLHSIHFQDFPIKCSRILNCGTKAIFGSNKRYYFSYDLLAAQEIKHFLPHKMGITQVNNFEISPCDKWITFVGRFGDFHLFENRSKEHIHSFQQEHEVSKVKFTADSYKIVTCCKGPTINIFDVRQQRLLHSFIDDGCIMGSVLDISPNSRMLATGSMEGVVNIYDYNKVNTTTTPNPEKSIMNLTTAITDIQFNYSSEMLAMCSKEVPNALKLVHFPSGRVFSNFPHFNSELKKFQVVKFSPQSGYLATGSINNSVPLFRLKHYKNY